MTIKHTPEPWPHFIEWCEPATPHPDSDGFVGLGFEDYRRARACVNACRGLPTDELEQKGLVAAVGAQLLEADQQRDELLEALELTWKVINSAGLGCLANGVELGQMSWLMKATDAKSLSDDVIAKVKGGAV